MHTCVSALHCCLTCLRAECRNAAGSAAAGTIRAEHVSYSNGAQLENNRMEDGVEISDKELKEKEKR